MQLPSLHIIANPPALPGTLLSTAFVRVANLPAKLGGKFQQKDSIAQRNRGFCFRGTCAGFMFLEGLCANQILLRRSPTDPLPSATFDENRQRNPEGRRTFLELGHCASLSHSGGASSCKAVHPQSPHWFLKGDPDIEPRWHIYQEIIWGFQSRFPFRDRCEFGWCTVVEARILDLWLIHRRCPTLEGIQPQIGYKLQSTTPFGQHVLRT